MNHVRVRRWVFAAYALLLFTLTHVPNVKIEATWRPDLFMHVAAFTGWTCLLILAAFFGPILSTCNLAAAAALGVAYAAIDEVLQAIPFINRHAAIDDWAADCLGVLLACTIALILRVAIRRKTSAQA